MKNKKVVYIQTGKDFLKEGNVVSVDKEHGLTVVKFGINDTQILGHHMFIFKKDMVSSLNGIETRDIKYFLWDDIVYKIEILFLIKKNKNRFIHEDKDRFVGICKSPMKFFGSKYISDEPIESLFNTMREAKQQLLHNKIKKTENEIKIKTDYLNKLYKALKSEA